MRTEHLLRLIFAGIAAASLMSCTVGPNFVPPRMNLPAQFTEHVATPAEIAATTAELAAWWNSFNDPILTRLIANGIAGNINIRIADQRLLEARAERDEAASGAYPTVNAIGEVSRARSSTTLEYPPGVGRYHDYILGFDASWELDIFGKTRRATEAADYNVRASIAAKRALLVSLTSEIAFDYASLRAAQLRFSIAHDDVRIAQQVLSLAQREFTGGIGTDLESLQARSQLEAVQAALPGLQAQVAVMSHAIAVLLGRYPGALEDSLKQPMPLMHVPATLPATVPAAVIGNRPDVHEAEMRYAAANARIGVAVAARLPQFSIPISLTPESSALNDLFSAASLTFSLALSGVQPLYQGGLLNARVRQARAAAEAARLNYKQSVLAALREVEDALIRVETDRAAQASLEASLRDANTALKHAQRLYHAGLLGFLTVLTDERSVFTARNAVAGSDTAVVQDYIALFKALGGGWTRKAVPDRPVIISVAAKTLSAMPKLRH